MILEADIKKILQFFYKFWQTLPQPYLRGSGTHIQSLSVIVNDWLTPLLPFLNISQHLAGQNPTSMDFHVSKTYQ